MQQSPRRSIRAYRVYLLDRLGKIATAHDVEAGSDDEACELANLILTEQSSHPSVEIWDRARRIRRLPENF